EVIDEVAEADDFMPVAERLKALVDPPDFKNARNSQSRATRPLSSRLDVTAQRIRRQLHRLSGQRRDRAAASVELAEEAAYRRPLASVGTVRPSDGQGPEAVGARHEIELVFRRIG